MSGISGATCVFSASFAQQRLWLIDRLMPGNPFYTIQSLATWKGVLETEVLRRAINEIIRRHESLRTCFEEIDGEPRQVVHADFEIDVPAFDLKAVSGGMQGEGVLREAAQEAARPFDLSRLPLLRGCVFHLGAEEHVLLLTIHHIVADGWSLGVFYRELRDLYAAFVMGRPNPLEELTIQYADFAIWQRDWLRGEVLDKQLLYWKQRLAGVSPLELPTDRRRRAVPSFQAAAHRFHLPGRLVEQLRMLTRSRNATLFMVLLAGFEVLLRKYTGQTDFVVGLPLANRPRPELEPLIGFFVNTLPLPADVGGNPSFLKLLERVRDSTLGAYDHQDVPFEKLVEELRPERNLARNPLFQVTFQLHNAPTLTWAEQSAAAPRDLEPRRLTTNFDLVLDLWETKDGLAGRIDYQTELLDASTVARFASHFANLLENIAASPSTPVSELQMLFPKERRALLEEWNDTADAYPRDATVPELFEEWASRTPEAIALQMNDQRIRYGEMSAAANRVAHWLCQRGAGIGWRVAVCMERSLSLYGALLGILKCGAAYVAVDPDDPRRRRDEILADSGAQHLLMTDVTADLFPGWNGERLVLDATLSELRSYSPDALPCRADPVAPAYVAYTSGSTGRPKGVIVPHRAIVRLARQNRYADFAPTEVFLQLAPISFDASTLEIWCCLLNGAKLVVYPPGALSLEGLGRSVRSAGITVLWLTAGLFHQMVDNQLESLMEVRQILAGGDVLSPVHVRKILAAPGRRVLINGYGPTENTTFTACHRMYRPEDVEDSVPIGKPIANTRVYVLDEFGHPSPIGVPGELHVVGDGLALGYFNAPDLTAARFVAAPAHLRESGLMYRTGDRVRWRADGVLEFLGRVDRQVKIRGFRIEPGEIEAHLSAHPAIGQAAVIVSGEGAEKRLIAYVTTALGGSVAGLDLGAYLAERLPSYMVPADFVVIPEIPLNAKGKVEVSRLPVPERGANRATPDDFSPPESDAEVALANIWKSVLKVERIDRRASFFTDYGGHSLMATQVVSRIRETFGVEFPLRLLFETPTIRELALHIEDALLAQIQALEDDEVQNSLGGIVVQQSLMEASHVD